ncbi:MAG: FHA domain-containing protein [Anaerolineales bacterium]|nr:FHA domain-containing protein [Anaerolineales bacterium]
MSGAIVLTLRILAALALYGFFGWTLFFLYREVRQRGSAVVNRRAPKIGVSFSAADGAKFLRQFDQTEISVGRAPNCDISLADDAVSARHARLIYHHSQWWLEDLESTNGTRLNNAPLVSSAVIASGDEIQCGNYSLLVQIADDVLVAPTVPLSDISRPR